ncbi:hypothetical protein NDU88_005896 [Pleurodeles waltl]|uniref:Uncharacterized protein n=1 Tax=Pleurodeles waltl TaxID=8319 RepID=A0AAV7N0P9_PLEWA|nr:hypothetical protein NDU88_005896 [Pleurodeles waltl]
MDRMLERLDKHVESPDMVERCVSETEEEQVTASAAQKRMEKALLTLQAKTEDPEARSCHNNLIFLRLAQSTNISNIERFMEWLLLQIQG